MEENKKNCLLDTMQGQNGNTLSTCMSSNLSDMCDNPKIIEDAQWLLDDLSTTVIGLEAQVKQLTILLEYYELKAMKKERSNILWSLKYRKE